MSGLGITFEPQPVYYEAPQPVHSPYYAQKQSYAHPSAPHGRRLLHSVSHDDGLRQYMHAQQQYVDGAADYLTDSPHKRVRIAAGTPEVLNGKGGYLPYDPNRLSPLSDFDPSTTSETGSSQPFSPASLSSLPSSTESGAYATFQQPSAAVYPIRHDIPYAHEGGANRRISLHANQPLQHAPAESRSQRPSRLPAFLQERQAHPAMQRPKSMVELCASQKQADDGCDRVHWPPLDVVVDYASADPPTEGASEAKSRQSRLRQSEGRPRRLPPPEKAATTERVRSRSLSAQELRQLAHGDPARERGVTVEVAVSEELPEVHDAQQLSEAPSSSVDSFVEASATADLHRQPTLLTTGASTVRRRKELDRLLAPNPKHLSFGSFASSHERKKPLSGSSSRTAASHRRAASESSVPSTSLPSPVALEQAKGANRARVELDLVLETPLVVEGGQLKGRLDVRVRQLRGREEEVWISKPKIRIIGFEGASCRFAPVRGRLLNTADLAELASGDGRYVFFHHAATIDSPEFSSSACSDSDGDAEDFYRARVGQHTVPVEMLVPIGRGAKGPWKGKQGVVRYIAIACVHFTAATSRNPLIRSAQFHQAQVEERF